MEKDKQGLPNPKEPQTEEETILDDLSLVASSMECTGLMPTPPASEEEMESYADIYPIPQAGPAKGHGLQEEKGTHPPQRPSSSQNK